MKRKPPPCHPPPELLPDRTAAVRAFMRSLAPSVWADTEARDRALASLPAPERVAGIACPMVGFYGALDARINAGLPAFAEAMTAAGKAFEHQVYQGAPHSFFNDTGPAYRVGAARDSFARLLEFFRRHLAP